MNKDMKKLVADGYERIEYEKAFRLAAAPNAFEKRFLDAFCAHIPPGGDILDLGCGVGLPYDRYLVDKGFRLTGIDFCKRHLTLARQNVPEAVYRFEDFTQIAFPAGSFHAVLALYAVFHIPRAEHCDLFTRIHTWLRPAGALLVTLGTSDGAYGEEPDWLGAPMAWSTYTPDAYKTMLSQTGFEIQRTDYEGEPGDAEYHFWLIGKNRTEH